MPNFVSKTTLAFAFLVAATTADYSRAPQGCTLDGASGVCGSENGFALSECGNLKLQAAFNFTEGTCNTKAAATLDDCASRHVAGTPLPDECKVAGLTFQVKGEQGQDGAWLAQRNVATNAGNICNTRAAKLVQTWFLTAIELVKAVAAPLCGTTSITTGGVGGRRLLEMARAGTPVHASPVEPATCLPATCTHTNLCPSGDPTGSSAGSAMKDYACMNPTEERSSSVRRLLAEDGVGGARRGNSPPSPTPAPAPPSGGSARRRTLSLENKMSAGYQWNCNTNLGCVGAKFTTSQVQTTGQLFGSSSITQMACSSAKQANECTFGTTTGRSSPLQRFEKRLAPLDLE